MTNFLPGKWVALLYRSTQMFMNNKLAESGIGAGQYPFILFIGRCSGCSQDEITKALCFDKGTTARAIQKLEQEGYITREVSNDDHRKNEVYITPKGMKKRSEIRKILEDWHNKLFLGVSEEMKSHTIETLKKMAENAISQVK